MNKKTVCSIAAGIVILLCCVLYFRPLSLSANITENNSLIVQIKEFVVRNEVPYIDSRDHDHIAEEQKRKITELMQGYSYKRTWKTSFSDGTIERIGNRAVFLYVYDHEAEVRSIYVSDSGQVSIDNKLYKMKNAEQFNAQVETILRSNYDLHLAEFGPPPTISFHQCRFHPEALALPPQFQLGGLWGHKGVEVHHGTLSVAQSF